MNNTTALIFGTNKYATEITNNVVNSYGDVRRFSLEKEDILDDRYFIKHFDLSDNWEETFEDIDVKNSIAFCVLEDSAQNIFLTISLRANFEDLTIIALATNQESANKLDMAGANKVIPIVETTSDIITNMLEKPISNTILHDILYKESALKIAQIKITCDSHFKDEQLSNIDWGRYHGIIVLSVMHEDMSSEFIYSSKARHHVVQIGDILVVVGFEQDIEDFKKSIGGETCQ